MFLSNLLFSYSNATEDADGNMHYDYPDVWTSFAKDSLASVFLYVAIVLAALLLAVGIFVYLKKNEQLRAYLFKALAIGCGFALSVIVAMFSLEIMDMRESGAIVSLLLYPTVALGAIVLLGGAACYVASLYGKKPLKITAIIAISAAVAAFVAVLVCMGIYYAQTIDGDGYYNSDSASVNQIVLYLSAFVLIALIVGAGYFFDRHNKQGFDSKSIAYAAICVAMSFALSYFKPISLPQGGSVTVASLLPLMIYSYMFGTKKGVFAGFIYGLLQAIQDPWIIHPAQFMLDYPVAFAAIGLAGLFARNRKLEKLPQVQFALGAVVASSVRFLSHVLSGVFAFSAYAEGQNPWAYSLAYNCFVFVDIAIVIVAGVFVFSSKAFVKQVKKFDPVPTEKLS